MIPDIAINIDINAGVFINNIGYYISLIIRIYYSLNGTIGPNVLSIGLVYLLLA